jgi:hypothetical protein
LKFIAGKTYPNIETQASKIKLIRRLREYWHFSDALLRGYKSSNLPSSIKHGFTTAQNFPHSESNYATDWQLIKQASFGA